MPPAVPAPTAEAAVFNFNWLSATGTGIFIAAVLAGLLMGMRPRAIAHVFLETLVTVRFTLVTIAALMAIGFITRYCGMDATLGLAFARTGAFYPFFGTLIGWIGTASTGSDTSSNVLFGSLQKLTAQQLNISPYLMASANSIRRRNGQDGRPPKHRRRHNSHGELRQRRHHPSLRLPAQSRARLPGRCSGLDSCVLTCPDQVDTALTLRRKQYPQVAQVVPRRPCRNRVAQQGKQRVRVERRKRPIHTMARISGPRSR